MVLLANLTALAAAASIVNIQDPSKQHALDFSAGDVNCDEYTTVQNWSYLNNANQKWTLVGGPFAYQIFSAECNKYWAYLGEDTGAQPLHSSIVARSASAAGSFVFSSVNTSNGLWNILEANSGLAVTAWNLDSRTTEPTAPITLEALSASDTRQQFWLTTV